MLQYLQHDTGGVKMGLFSRLLNKKQKKKVPLPSWEQTVEIMHNKNLSCIDAEEILQVVYTKDKTKRAIILKDKKGLYGYLTEELFPFDENEWQFVSQDENALPGMWIGAATGLDGSSYFSTQEDAMKELMCDPWYKHFF